MRSRALFNILRIAAAALLCPLALAAQVAGGPICTPTSDGTVVNVYDDEILEEALRIGALPPATRDGVPFTERFLSVAGDESYVVQRGWDRDGNCRAWAMSVADLGAVAAVVHQCNGDPCSSCAFERDKDRKITGCKCNEAGEGKKCNHSITTTQGQDTHKCTGNPCSSCEFAKTGETITGCDCKDGDEGCGNGEVEGEGGQDGGAAPKCDHSITTVEG